MKSKGFTKDYPLNYIDGLDEIDYALLYNKVRISKKIREYTIFPAWKFPRIMLSFSTQ